MSRSPRALLGRPRLSVISGEPDGELDRLAARITPSVRVRGRRELEALLSALGDEAEAGAPVTPKALDLIGHSTARGSLLRLGDWVLDPVEPAVAAWLHALAAQHVLPRLGVDRVRLLGCGTAATPEGRAAIEVMAAILGVEVAGATQLLYDAHYGVDGFRDEWSFLLVGASEPTRAARGPVARGPRSLELDALPVVPGAPASPRWPTRIASAEQARQLLGLVRRGSGAPMAAPVAPSCAVAWTAASGGYHVAHVLLEGAFLQVYPDGLEAPGVAFAAGEPEALWELVAALPPAEVIR